MAIYSKIMLFVLLWLLSGCYGVMKIRCPDGQIAIVQKSPEKQYKQYVKSSENKIKATIDILDKIKLGGLDASTNRQVTLLRQQLDQYSARNEDALKSSFLYVNTKPCDTAGQNEHNRLLKELNTTSADVEKLRLQLETTGNDEAKLKGIIESYFSSNLIKTCNIRLTDNYTFYFIIQEDSKAIIKPFTLPYSDVIKSDSLEVLLVGFFPYIEGINKQTYLTDSKIFRLVDEKVIGLKSDKSAKLKDCNNGLLIIPQNVINSFGDDHLAFTYIKSMIK